MVFRKAEKNREIKKVLRYMTVFLVVSERSEVSFGPITATESVKIQNPME